MKSSIFLSIVMPAYNEAANIELVLEEHVAIARQLPPIVTNWEVVCLDDGSRDGTAEIIENICRRTEKLRLVRHRANKGIYQSFQDLYGEARGTHIYATASDGQWPAQNLLTMFDALDRGADLVIGERQNRRSTYSMWRRFVSCIFNLLPRLLFGVATRDAGSIKLGITDVFRLPLISRSPFVEAERIIAARRRGFRVEFAPVEFLPRTKGQARGADLSNIRASLRDCFKLLRPQTVLSTRGSSVATAHRKI
jgi:glycosyltransferase involved in cell wall biosynthesis